MNTESCVASRPTAMKSSILTDADAFSWSMCGSEAAVSWWIVWRGTTQLSVNLRMLCSCMRRSHHRNPKEHAASFLGTTSTTSSQCRTFSHTFHSKHATNRITLGGTVCPPKPEEGEAPVFRNSVFFYTQVTVYEPHRTTAFIPIGRNDGRRFTRCFPTRSHFGIEP